MSTWSDPAKRIAFRQAGFSLATTPRRRGGRDFLILLFTETTEIFRETARNNWDVYGTGRGEEKINRRDLRCWMACCSSDPLDPTGNGPGRATIACSLWEFAAPLAESSDLCCKTNNNLNNNLVQRRWGGRGRLSNRVNLPRHILQPFPRVITVDKMEGGSKLCIVYCTMDTMKDPCNRHK